MAGELARLRTAQGEDLQTLASWWMDPETLRLQSGVGLHRGHDEIVQMFQGWSSNDSHGSVGFAIEEIKSGNLCGHVTVYGAALPDACGTLGILLGPMFRGQGIGSDAVRAMLGFAFEEMNLNRVELQVWSYNVRAVKAYERAGFVKEGIRRQASWQGGQYRDVLSMGALRDDYNRPIGRNLRDDAERFAGDAPGIS